MNNVTATNGMVLPAPGVRLRSAAMAPVDKWGVFFVAVTIVTWLSAFIVGFKPPLAVMTAIGFLASIYGLQNPGVGLIGTSILCTLDAATRAFLFSGGSLPWNTYNYWLLVVILLSLGLLFRLHDIISRFLQLFVVILLFGLLFTPALDLGQESFLNVVTVFGLIVYFLRGGTDRRVWYWQGLVGGLVGALGGLAYFAKLPASSDMNANAFGYFPLTGLFAVVLGYQYIPPGRKSSLMYAALAVANLVWIFLSGSRGTLLVGLMCMLFFLLSVRSLSQRIAYIAVGVFIVLITVTAFTDLTDNMMHRIDKLINEDETATARTSGRSDLAKGAYYIFLDNPMGVGTGGFADAWARMGYKQELSGFRYGQHVAAHSGWAKTLADNGIPGILALVGFVASFTIVGWRRRQEGKFLLIGFFMTTIFIVAWMSTEFAGKGLWFMAAAGIMLLNARSPGRKNGPVGTPPQRNP